jgi:hypothetical protein
MLRQNHALAAEERSNAVGACALRNRKPCLSQVREP